MENDIDIYEDLPSFQAIENDSCGQRNEELIRECDELKKHVTDLLLKLENFQKINKNLEVNLSSLLKTAKAEIARKDKTIEELRKRLDDASFRRGPHSRAPVSAARTYPQCRNFQEHTPQPTERHTSSQELEYATHFGTQEFGGGERRGRASRAKHDRAPTTVFSERLRRRIAEEEGVDVKEKTECNVDTKGDLGNLHQDRTAESDKENGARRDVANKENQSRSSMRHSRVDNVALHEKDVSFPNILDPSYQETEVNSSPRHEAVTNRKSSAKREMDGTADMPNVKRTKVCDRKEMVIEEEKIVERRNVSADRAKLNQKWDQAQVSKIHCHAERSAVEEEYNYPEKKEYQCGEGAPRKDEDINSRAQDGGSCGRDKDAIRQVPWNGQSIAKRKYVGRETSAERPGNGRHLYDRRDSHRRIYSPTRVDRYRMRQRDSQDKESRVGQWSGKKGLEFGCATRNYGRVKIETKQGSRERMEDRRRVSRTRELYDLHGKSKRWIDDRDDMAESWVSKDRKYGNKNLRCERSCVLNVEETGGDTKLYTISKARNLPGDGGSCRKSEERYGQNAKMHAAEDLPGVKLGKSADEGEEACIRLNGLSPSETTEMPSAANSSQENGKNLEMEIGSSAVKVPPAGSAICQLIPGNSEGSIGDSLDGRLEVDGDGWILEADRPKSEEGPSAMPARASPDKSDNEQVIGVTEGTADETTGLPGNLVRPDGSTGPASGSNEGAKSGGAKSTAVGEDAVDKGSGLPNKRVTPMEEPVQRSSGGSIIEHRKGASSHGESEALVEQTLGAIREEYSRSGKPRPMGCPALQAGRMEEKEPDKVIDDSSSGTMVASKALHRNILLQGFESGRGGTEAEVDACGNDRMPSNAMNDPSVETGLHENAWPRKEEEEQDKAKEEEVGGLFDGDLAKRGDLKAGITECNDRRREANERRNGQPGDTTRLKIESEVESRTDGQGAKMREMMASVATDANSGCDTPAEERAKVIVLARRRKPMRLADSNANMTILVNSNNTCFIAADTSSLVDDDGSSLKPRACKLQRSYKNGR